MGPYAGELRLTFGEAELDELALGFAPAGGWDAATYAFLKDPASALIVSVTPCRLGKDHATRLGLTTPAASGVCIQTGFSRDSCSRIETVPFSDGARFTYRELKMPYARDLFKPKELAAKVTMPPPLTQRFASRAQTPTEGVDTVDADSAESAADTVYLWGTQAMDTFCNVAAHYEFFYEKLDERALKGNQERKQVHFIGNEQGCTRNLVGYRLDWTPALCQAC